MSESKLILEMSGVIKEFPDAPGVPRVLKGVDLQIRAGESIAIIGPSGSGKSTLLNLIGALDRPSGGSVAFDGQNVQNLNEEELAAFRNRSIGFVFQLHHLLPQCTALENVLVPTLVSADAADARDRAVKLLERVGLADRMSYRPGVLSGGERQRVAVVRALINRPSLLLADEPTGSLSPEGAGELVKLMLDLNREENMAMIVVTHSLTVAQAMDRILVLDDGRLAPHTQDATP